MTPQEEAVTVIQAGELRALIAKATDDDLADGGRYFSGSCDDLTRCRHEEIGEYQHASDGELIEWLWNHRHAILDRFTRTSSSDAATPDVDVLRAALLDACSTIERLRDLTPVRANEVTAQGLHGAVAAIAGAAFDRLLPVLDAAPTPGEAS